jgi:malonate decarboxylase delta subunit
MRTLRYKFPASSRPPHRAHVGVVGSGDLEILLEPGKPDSGAEVSVRTSVEGFDEVWEATLARFFARTPLLGTWELNDAGATPALVTLRLQQVATASGATEPITSESTHGGEAS